MDKVASHVSIDDKRAIAEHVVRQIKDHMLCDNKACFNVINLRSDGSTCHSCNGTFCFNCQELCEATDDYHSHCQSCSNLCSNNFGSESFNEEE